MPVKTLRELRADLRYHQTRNRLAARHRVYIARGATMKVVRVYWHAWGTAGSSNDISVYIRVNNTDDYLVNTLGNTAAAKVFLNAAIDIAFFGGDYFEIKIVCPTWTTNPTGVRLSFTVYLETA
jgi:hypothetical protein